MNLFTDLSLSRALSQNLARHLFQKPTAVQAEAIPHLLEGRDVVATAQTGTGKTLAFAIPVIEALATQPRTKGIQALILSPTRELAIQIEETFAKLIPNTGLRTAVVVGGLSENRQLQAIRGGAGIVIATPGRLCDFLQRNLVDLSKTTKIVLDEADRMLDMGFLPSLRLILKSLPEERHTMLFSATIEKSVAHLIASHVKNPVRVNVGVVTKPAELVDLRLFEVEGHRKFELLVHLAGEETGSMLVFARTKHGADRLANNLGRRGIKAARIHGDRTQAQRSQALQGFKDGDYRLLVATDVAARGIHVDGIAHVVNYDLPQVAEDFIHRVGRTGRAGVRGSAWTFAIPAERSEIRNIEKQLGTRMEKRALPELPENVPMPKHEGGKHGSEKLVVMPSPEAARNQRNGFKRSFKSRRRFAGR